MSHELISVTPAGWNPRVLVKWVKSQFIANDYTFKLISEYYIILFYIYFIVTLNLMHTFLLL